MKPILFRISVLAAANRRILQNSHYLAFSTFTPQNPTYGNRRHEDEGRSIPVSVWWDFENCQLPSNTNVYRVSQCITNAVRANGIRGPIQVTAFGDVMQISRTNQKGLSATGINLFHVPSGEKNSADRSLLMDLMYWVSQNPPPAHIFLISGDRDFAGILHKLKMSNYNILLASSDNAPNVLCSAATIMWQWSCLLKGEGLAGKLFNQPPDGPYNSWYGHYKVPLEDPFAVVEQSSCVPAGESVRPIPKTVIKLIRQILKSYPEGISLSQFGEELSKNNLAIDKGLYGYKKISHFLSAMPHVVKLHESNKYIYIVKAVGAKCPDEVAPTACIGESETRKSPQPSSEINSVDDITENPQVSQFPQPIMTAQSNSEESQKGERQRESSSVYNPGVKVTAYTKKLQDPKEEKLVSSPAKRNMQEIQEQDETIKLQEKTKKVLATSTVGESKDYSGENKNRVVGPAEVFAPESGIFKRIWLKWFVSGHENPKEKNCKKHEEVKSGKDNVEDKTAISCESTEFVFPALFSPSSHEAFLDGKLPRGGGDVTDISSQGFSSLTSMTSWLKFWGSSGLDTVEKSGEAIDQVKVHSKQLELFSEVSFWNELESFMATSQGAAVFSQSRTREHLVQNLQKQGPPVLKSLPEGNLLYLIDLLISDKKWVEECTSQAFPFTLPQAAGKDRVNNPPSGPNGLSQIFAGKQLNLQELGEQKHQNPSDTGVHQNVVHRGSSSKSRNEMLADCQKLVIHIVKEYPEGYNMACFRKLFMEKHGYALDLQKLGFDKLVNLLQTMSDVRIESSLIFPVGTFKSRQTDLPIQGSKTGPVSNPSRESSISSHKDDDMDSCWDELGPVASSGPGKQETNVRLTKKSQKGKTVEKLPEYEPLNEDDFTDSEEETSSSSPESKLDEERSSLLQILDSWYTNKGDDDKDKPRGTTNSIDDDTTGTGSLPSKPTGSRAKAESPAVKRHKPLKTYSFVVEKANDAQDKLVDGILGNLKKSSSDRPTLDSRMLG